MEETAIEASAAEEKTLKSPSRLFVAGNCNDEDSNDPLLMDASHKSLTEEILDAALSDFLDISVEDLCATSVCMSVPLNSDNTSLLRKALNIDDSIFATEESQLASKSPTFGDGALTSPEIQSITRATCTPASSAVRVRTLFGRDEDDGEKELGDLSSETDHPQILFLDENKSNEVQAADDIVCSENESDLAVIETFRPKACGPDAFHSPPCLDVETATRNINRSIGSCSPASPETAISPRPIRRLSRPSLSGGQSQSGSPKIRLPRSSRRPAPTRRLSVGLTIRGQYDEAKHLPKFSQAELEAAVEDAVVTASAQDEQKIKLQEDLSAKMAECDGIQSELNEARSLIAKMKKDEVEKSQTLGIQRTQITALTRHVQVKFVHSLFVIYLL